MMVAELQLLSLLINQCFLIVLPLKHEYYSRACAPEANNCIFSYLQP